MFINWFQIKNFKSIIDSGKCYLEKGITILAGKNESGKTSILEALECIEKGKIGDEYNSMYTEDKASVTISYHITKEELSEILESFELNDFIKIQDFDLEVTLCKSEFSIAGIDFIVEKLHAFKSKIEEDIIKVEDELHEVFIKYADILKDKFNVQDLYDNLENIIVQNDEFFTENLKENDNIILSECAMEISRYRKLSNIIENFSSDFVQNMKKFLPSIVLFSSFNDILPDSITLQNKDTKIVQSLCKIVDMDVENILSLKDTQMRAAKCNGMTASITGDFSNFYNQNDLNLKFSVDGESLNFFIYDSNSQIPFRPAQRSKGFQWFLSFYITLKAQNQKNSSCIILIDEPGLYLHPNGQQDMLKILVNLSKNSQIIFTTHSPYLMDPNNLQRIRLVEKEKIDMDLKGENYHTIIKNKLQAYSNSDTLTPIITAIGYNLSLGLNINLEGMIVVEGISDNYYINKFYQILGLDNDYSIIYASGASQVPNIVSILIGWGVKNIVCVLDNDKEGKNVKNTLKNKLNFDNIVFIPLNDCSIEDIISKDDFTKYALKGQETLKDKNSKVVKSMDKVLISKLFSSNNDVSASSLDSESIKNITQLIDLIENKKIELRIKRF